MFENGTDLPRPVKISRQPLSCFGIRAVDRMVYIFLIAVENQAKENCVKAQEVFKLHAATINNIHRIINSKDSIPIVDSIFRKPIFSLSDIASLSGGETHNVRRIIGAMVDSGIIRVLAPSSGRRPAIYLFEQLMVITEGL